MVQTHSARPRNYTISPSLLTFLWEECPRCAYYQVRHGFKRPSTPMPSIFNKIDASEKECFLGQRTETARVGLPGGVFAHADNWVESVPLTIPGQAATIALRGRIDTLAALDDGTHAILDFKTSDPRSTHIPLYARQLHAYALAMENAAPGKFAIRQISMMGLLVFEPRVFKMRDGNNSGGIGAYFGGAFKWVGMERDDPAFLEFLAGVVSVLDNPAPPASSPACPYCGYLDTARRSGFLN